MATNLDTALDSTHQIPSDNLSSRIVNYLPKWNNKYSELTKLLELNPAVAHLEEDITSALDKTEKKGDDILLSKKLISDCNSLKVHGSNIKKKKKLRKENPYKKFVDGGGVIPVPKDERYKSTIAITEFVDWCSNIDGEPFCQLILEEMLKNEGLQIEQDISFVAKEMIFLPLSLSNFRQKPKLKIMSLLREHLKEDLAFERTPDRTVGFGKSLPRNDPVYFKTPTNRVGETLLPSRKAYPELESMEVVFKGIETLRSTMMFCMWLKKHPNIPPPIYLKNFGVMDMDHKLYFENITEIGDEDLERARASVEGLFIKVRQGSSFD